MNMKKCLAVSTTMILSVCVVSPSAAVNVVPTDDAVIDSVDVNDQLTGERASLAWNNASGRILRTMELYDLTPYAGSTVTGATYTFELKSLSGRDPDAAQATINIHATTQAWSESDSGVNWTNFNSSFNPTVLDTIGPLPSTAVGGDVFTVSIEPSIIQNWIDNPGSNLGWYMKLTDADEAIDDRRGWDWWGKDAELSDPEQGAHPFLTLQGDIVPEPAGLSLIALGGALMLLRHPKRS